MQNHSGDQSASVTILDVAGISAEEHALRAYNKIKILKNHSIFTILWVIFKISNTIRFDFMKEPNTSPQPYYLVHF